MASLFNLDDLVVYENVIYIIKSIIYIDGYVYGIVPVDQSDKLILTSVHERFLIKYEN